MIPWKIFMSLFQTESLSINVSKLINKSLLCFYLAFANSITFKIADKRQATSNFVQLYYLSSNATHACHHRLRTPNEGINKNKSLKFDRVWPCSTGHFLIINPSIVSSFTGVCQSLSLSNIR